MEESQSIAPQLRSSSPGTVEVLSNEDKRNGLMALAKAAEQQADGSSQSDEAGGSQSVRDTGDEDAESDPKGGALKHFNDLAGRLGIDVSELYKLEVTDSKDGTKHTIESLKGLLADRDEFNARALKWEQERINKETAHRQAEEEFRTLVNALPKAALKPEILELARKKHEATVRVERQRTLDAIPEWKDQAVAERDLKAMAEHLASYGYPKEYLESQIYDHRTFRLLRDFTLLKQRVEQQLAAVERVKTNGIPKAKSTYKSAKPTNNNKPMTREERQVARMLEAFNKPQR